MELVIEVDLAAVDERWLGLEGRRWLLEEGGLFGVGFGRRALTVE